MLLRSRGPQKLQEQLPLQQRAQWRELLQGQLDLVQQLQQGRRKLLVQQKHCARQRLLLRWKENPALSWVEAGAAKKPSTQRVAFKIEDAASDIIMKRVQLRSDFRLLLMYQWNVMNSPVLVQLVMGT